MTDGPVTTTPARAKWLSIVGNCEAVLALVILVYSFTIEVRPGTQRQSTIHAVSAIGIGAGFAVGGVRFAGSGTKPFAWFVAAAYALLITALVVTSFIPRETLTRFWSSIFPVL
jgi:hypothetical protein